MDENTLHFRGPGSVESQLSDVTDRELEQEVKRRKEKARAVHLPRALKNPDWAKVVSRATGYIARMNQNPPWDNIDIAGEIFQDVMCAVYGDNIINWITRRTVPIPRSRQ